MFLVSAQEVLLASVVRVLHGEVWPVELFHEPLGLADDPGNLVLAGVGEPRCEFLVHVALDPELALFR